MLKSIAVMINKISLLWLCLFWLLPTLVFAQSNIPQWAVEGQLSRKTFQMKMNSPQVIKVTSESDFKKLNNHKNVVFDVRADIFVSSPIVFSGKCNVQVNGNGHRIAPQYPNPRSFSKPMKAQFWSYDTVSGLAKVVLSGKSEWPNLTEANNVYVFYEAWFQRFSDKVISSKGNEVTFRCTHEKMKNPKYLKLTPTPVIFFAKRAPYPKGVSALDALVHVEGGATVDICNMRLEGVDAGSCINNKGTLRISYSKVLNCENDGVVSSGSLFVDHSSFCDITKYAVTSIQNSYTDVQHCTFRHIGMRGSNSACVHSRGNAYVANNDFVDFNYCAISLGYISVDKESYLPSSIVENNRISWSKSWGKLMQLYGLCDGGAIYIATNNKRCILRNNVILNFGGHGSNRGIYCDDGAYNVTIYGNVITGTQNSYDIDSRDCSKNPQRQRPVGYDVNTYNYIGYNICSGKLNMHGSSAKKPNNCCFENNVIVGVSDSNESVVKNNILDKKAILYDRKAKITRLGKVRLKETKSVVGL